MPNAGTPNITRVAIPAAGRYIAFPSISCALTLSPRTGIVRLDGTKADFDADTSPIATTFAYLGESIEELSAALGHTFHSYHWASNGLYLRGVGGASNVVVISYHH
jgi:hypothetical protein